MTPTTLLFLYIRIINMLGGVGMNILLIILCNIIVLAIISFIIYKLIQTATKKRVSILENEAEELLKKATREAEATKKESILEAKEEVHLVREEMKFKDLKEELFKEKKLLIKKVTFWRKKRKLSIKDCVK